MRYVNHKIRWKGGILALLISAMLLYTLATVYAEEETGPQADVSVEWRPEVSEAETGEKVAIRLSSYIDTERAESADIKIALTEEEASMLGNLPEGLALEHEESGGLYLAFRLTKEQPSLDVELTASAPAKVTASASIEVTEEDIQIEAEGKTVDTPQAPGEPEAAEQPEKPEAAEEPEAAERPEVPETPEETPETQEETAPPSSGEETPKAGAEEKELSLVQAPVPGSGTEVTGGVQEEASLVLEKKGGSLSFTADFGWALSLAGEKDGDGNPVFTAEARSENREETGTVYTKEQSLAFTLALPEEYALGGGEPVFDEASQALKVNGNMLIQISGLPETAVITEVRKADGSTLSFTVARNTEWNGESGQEPEELSDLELALTVDRGGLDALKTDAEEAEAGAQAPETQGADALPEIRLDAKLSSVPLAGETKTQDASEILSLGAGTQGTDAGQQEENGGLIETLVLEPSIVAEESEGGFRQEIFWADNRNEGGKRPEEGAYPEPILHFTVTEVDEHGQPVEGASGKQMELTKDNMGELGLTAMPKPTIAENAVGNYTLTYSDLPTLVSQTDIYGDTTWYKIEWDRMTPSTADGYALMEVTEEMIDEGEVQSVETPGWYYVLETDFTFELQFRWGDQGAANEAIKDVLGHLELLVQAGTVSGEYPLNQIPGTILKEDWDEDLDSVKITISGLWKYNLDGSQVGCSVVNPDGSSQISGTDIPSAGLDAGDSFALTYDNERVPNYGSVTDRLHNGGTLYLTLTGEKDYESKKVWLDEGDDTSKRPAGELQLWRYRVGQSYTTAAAVRDPKTNEILTVKLDSEGGNISFENLPKYDSEGYEYIYVVREYMESTTEDGGSADAYEQVFGTVKEDGTVDDTVLIPDGNGDLVDGGTRESGNTFLYNGGTLSNRIMDTVQTEASKTWKAAAFQADFDDVTVVLTLQSRVKGSQEEWQEAKNADGSLVTETLDEFTAENLTASVSRSMPRYNAFGKELEYRWVETAVYKGETLDDNLFTPDEDGDGDGGSFTLVQEGEEIEYVSDSRIDPDGEGTAEKPYDTEVVNSIANTLNYYAEKIWLDDDGEKYIPLAGEREADFNIYRVLSGGSLSGDDDPVATFTMDGAADENPAEITTSSGEKITVQETEPWKAVVTPLQMYDSEGREYEYILLETEEEYVPTYETIRDEDGNYWTTITNGPGSGNRITVRKEWIDDSDLLHREPITVGVYDSKTNERIADVTLSEGFWQQQVGIGEREPEDVYILEEKVGDFEVPLSFGEDPEDSGPEKPAYRKDDGSAGEYTAFQVETDNHRYEVTYRAPEEIAGETFHTVVNRRLGSVDVTVKKEWKDGDGEIRDAIEEELETLTGDNELTLAMKLDFADDSRRNTGNFQFEIDYAKNTVTISPGNKVPIQKPENEDEPSRENMENSAAIQELDLGQPESTYYFWNLPKYDLEGGVVHYQVTEVWLNSDNEEVNLTELAQQEPDIYGDLYDLWKEYSTSSEETYATEALHDVDTHTITVTNRLTGTKEILWHKQWNDAYNNQSGQRPDIYLDIYAVSHEKNGDQVTEKPVLYRENYRWTYSEAADPEPGEAGNPLYDKDVHWHAVLENVPKYDALGYEIQYYAVEKMLVDGASFDYQETAYQFAKDPENPTKLTEIGTVSAPAEDAINEGYVFDVSGMEGEGTDPCYALLEDGTFVNTIAGEVSIQGRKLWGNLPSEYPSVDLPEVTFGVY